MATKTMKQCPPRFLIIEIHTKLRGRYHDTLVETRNPQCWGDWRKCRTVWPLGNQSGNVS